MTDQATPGPWFATKATDRTPYDEEADVSGNYTLVSCDDDREVWTVSSDPNFAGWKTDGGYPEYGVTEANARLMAAAPDFAEGVAQMLAYEDAGGDGWWKGWEMLKAAYARGVKDA